MNPTHVVSSIMFNFIHLILFAFIKVNLGVFIFNLCAFFHYRPPRLMGEGFVVMQSNDVDIYYYMDEPGTFC